MSEQGTQPHTAVTNGEASAPRRAEPPVVVTKTQIDLPVITIVKVLVTIALILLLGQIWQILFLVGAGWYAIRARTWGKTIKYNKQWYDWAHCGMLFGMWWMFASPITGTIPMVLNIAFWTWFAGYYVYQTWVDLRAKPTFWSLGQDIAHLSMGVVMIAMTAWPHAWMPMSM